MVETDPTDSQSILRPSEVRLVTGVRVDCFEAIKCALELRGLRLYFPEQFSTLVALVNGIAAEPRDLAVPSGEVFPFVEDGKVEALARDVIAAGLRANSDGRFSLGDLFDLSDKRTSALVAEACAKLNFMTDRALTGLSRAMSDCNGTGRSV